jgi:hypothetical protein
MNKRKTILLGNNRCSFCTLLVLLQTVVWVSFLKRGYLVVQLLGFSKGLEGWILEAFLITLAAQCFTLLKVREVLSWSPGILFTMTTVNT